MTEFGEWGLPVIVGVGLMLAWTLTNAIADRIRGREEIRSCADCGDKLISGDGATCMQCRGRRRRTLEHEARQRRCTPGRITVTDNQEDTTS